MAGRLDKARSLPTAGRCNGPLLSRDADRARRAAACLPRNPSRLASVSTVLGETACAAAWTASHASLDVSGPRSSTAAHQKSCPDTCAPAQDSSNSACSGVAREQSLRASFRAWGLRLQEVGGTSDAARSTSWPPFGIAICVYVS
eukprot:scaffold15978_cov103-Isochrysis_galbana.AAC.6